MPIYEYRCDRGHTFEVIQRMSEDALETCEVCAAPAVRVLHAPAVHFKGSGFYTTDYARKGKKVADSSSSSSSESTSSSSDGSPKESKSSDSKGSDASKSSSSASSD